MLETELRNLTLAEPRVPPTAAGRSGRPAATPNPSGKPGTEYRAVDSSNSLWITVDNHGKVTHFEVSLGWKARLPADEFGNAVLTTYVSALGMVAATRGPDQGEASAAALAPEPSSGGSHNLDEWVASTRERQVAIDRQLRAARDDISREVTEIRGPYGYLTLRRRAGTVVGLETNTTAISRAHATQLQQDLWAVFTEAGLTSGDDPAPSGRRPGQPTTKLDDEDVFTGF